MRTDDQFSPEFLRELVDSGKGFLRFPAPLERVYRRLHRRETLAYYRRISFWVATLILVLVVVAALSEPIESLVAGLHDPTGFHRGMPIAVIILLVTMYSLPVVSRLRWLEAVYELWFVLLAGTALTCVLVSLLLVETTWMQYLWALGVMYGYTMLYGLSRQRILIKIATVLFSLGAAVVTVSLLDLEVEWRLVGMVFLGVNLLGGLLGYLDETREREHFLREQLMSREQERLHQLSETVAQENRLRERVNAMHEVMSGEDNPQVLADKILRHLVPAVDTLVGALYYREGDELRRLASVGLDDLQGPHGARLALGETLVGQCALDGKLLTLDNAPAGYLAIRSAVGECERPALTLLPLRHNARVCGVVELAGFRPFTAEDRRFLLAVAPSLAIALTSVHARVGASADSPA